MVDIREWKGLDADEEQVVLQDYFDDGSGREPRYYQRNAINAAIEVIAKGEDRVLLVMATGTGKTYTAFQIIWRLWKAGKKKRVLYLADRNVLIDRDGQDQLGNFIDPESPFPVLVTTSRLLSTRVDAQTCRLIVLDRPVGSMTFPVGETRLERREGQRRTNPTVQHDCRYGVTSALALAVEAAEALHLPLRL